MCGAPPWPTPATGEGQGGDESVPSLTRGKDMKGSMPPRISLVGKHQAEGEQCLLGELG
jgi:hypothetical protein